MIVIGRLNVFIVFFISLHFDLSVSQSRCKRKIKITEDAFQTHCYNETKSGNIICSSLQEALTQILNDSCVYLGNNITLNTTIYKENVFNLQFFSTTEQSSTVECENANLRFNRSSDIKFNNVNFKNCGYETEILWNEQILNISTALLFHHCERITVQNCKFNSSHGYGLVFIDSNKVNIDNISVMYSIYMPVLFQNETFYSGGGIFIHFQDTDNNNIFVKNSEFSNISTHYRDMPFSSVFNNLPYGRGAGILFSCHNGRKDNTLNVNNSVINYNFGNIGSGVYIDFAKNTLNNMFLFTGGNISDNQAEASGGGLFARCYSSHKNLFFLKDTIISGNEGEIGGAIAFVRPDTYTEYTQSGLLSLENVTIDNNHGQVGGTIHLQNVHTIFNNVTVSNSSVRSFDHSPGKGSLYALRSDLTFMGGDSYFSHNNNSAVVVDNSKMHVNGSITFNDNLGYNGGALAFYEHSELHLRDISQLKFFRNQAWSKGGAMYILSPGPSMMPWNTTELNTYTCFIKFSSNTTYKNFSGSVQFDKNFCLDGDSNDIFLSSLKNCRAVGEKNVRDVFVKWSNFTFTSNTSTIATNAVNVCPLIQNEWISYSGNLLKPHIVLKDERNSSVSESIDVLVRSSNVKIATNPAFVVSNDDSIKLQLKKLIERNESFNVTVKTTSHLFLETNITGLYFNPCPFGFFLDPKEEMCMCDVSNNEEKLIAFCDNEDIYLQKNIWVDNKTWNTYTCPKGYCRNNVTKLPYNLFNQSQQCNRNRNQSSRLCSKCLDNYSTVSGKHVCELCPPDSNGWIWVVSVIAIGLLAFIGLVMLANIDIMSYNLNICLYSYQIIYLLYTSEQEIDQFLNLLMTIFQVSPNGSYYSVCLWYGMTALAKIALSFTIPGFMIFHMIWLYFGIRCLSKTRCNLQVENWNLMERWYKAMSIVVVMCFSDLIRVSLELLHYIRIGDHLYVYQYADEPYLGPNHLPYALVSVVILVLILIGSCIQFILIVKPECVKWKWQWLRKFNNKVGTHFKEQRRLFWLVYFIVRVLLYIVGIILVNYLKLQKILLSLICLGFMGGFALFQPYKDKWVNVAETVVLATLTFISVIGVGMHYLNIEEIGKMEVAVNVLSYVPILVVLASLSVSHVCPYVYNRCQTNRGHRRG